MAGYYNQEDLPRFGEMGKDVPELWEKFRPGTEPFSKKVRCRSAKRR
jgi:hypothetical protein